MPKTTWYILKSVVERNVLSTGNQLTCENGSENAAWPEKEIKLQQFDIQD